MRYPEILRTLQLALTDLTLTYQPDMSRNIQVQYTDFGVKYPGDLAIDNLPAIAIVEKEFNFAHSQHVRSSTIHLFQFWQEMDWADPLDYRDAFENAVINAIEESALGSVLRLTHGEYLAIYDIVGIPWTLNPPFYGFRLDYDISIERTS